MDSIDDDKEEDGQSELQEITREYTQAMAKVEKEFAQRSSTTAASREKLEENYKRELERLQARKNDLEKQLDDLMAKFRERMSVVDLKRALLVNRVTDLEKQRNQEKSPQPTDDEQLKSTRDETERYKYTSE